MNITTKIYVVCRNLQIFYFSGFDCFSVYFILWWPHDMNRSVQKMVSIHLKDKSHIDDYQWLPHVGLLKPVQDFNQFKILY